MRRKKRKLEITHYAEQAVSGLIRAIPAFWALAAKERAVRPCGKEAGVWCTIFVSAARDGWKEERRNLLRIKGLRIRS